MTFFFPLNAIEVGTSSPLRLSSVGPTTSSHRQDDMMLLVIIVGIVFVCKLFYFQFRHPSYIDHRDREEDVDGMKWKQDCGYRIYHNNNMCAIERWIWREGVGSLIFDTLRAYVSVQSPSLSKTRKSLHRFWLWCHRYHNMDRLPTNGTIITSL